MRGKRLFSILVSASLLTLPVNTDIVPVFAEESQEAEMVTGMVEPITIYEGEVKKIVLENARINAVGKQSPAITVEAGATLDLIIQGENYLVGDSGYAGICVEPFYENDAIYLLEYSGVLNISGTGTLSVTGGAGTDDYGGGAGIGGNGQNTSSVQREVNIGKIKFSEEFTGSIMATGGNAKPGSNSYGAGAGIGTGGCDDSWSALHGQIEINSGTITTRGGDESDRGSEAGGAGLGGGGAAGGTTILNYITVQINGGKIRSTGMAGAAGLGGGNDVNSGTIKITGGEVYADVQDANMENPSFFCGAAIGGGDNAAANLIEITGGTVIADNRKRSGAGIGHGNHAAFGILEEDQDIIQIKISGPETTVFAFGGTHNGRGSAGIGLGISKWAKNYDHLTNIYLDDGATVYAYGGYHAQAIGTCYYNTESDKFNGTGFDLFLDDSVTLFAVNNDFNFPALLIDENREDHTYDISHQHYVSTERYLITYTDDNSVLPHPIIDGQAIGSLTLPEIYAQEYPEDAELDWVLSGNQMKMDFTDPRVSDIEPNFYPFTDSNMVGDSPLHGNWATLYPPLANVTYFFVGDEKPDKVTPPYEGNREYIKKGSKYSAIYDWKNEENILIKKDENGIIEYFDGIDIWTFQGWYEDPDLTIPYVDKEVTGSLRLYGAWSKDPEVPKNEWPSDGPKDPDPKPDPKPDPNPEPSPGPVPVPEKPAEPEEPGNDNPEPDTPEVFAKDHFAYIIGRHDGLIHAEDNMHRDEVVTVYLRMLKDEVRKQFWSKSNGYPDVYNDLWCNNAISTMTNMGVIQGYDDGLFRPGQNITRAEFAKIAVSFFEREDTDFYKDAEKQSLTNPTFTDTAKHWASRYIEKAVQFGFVVGYPDGTFKPDQPIKRSEAIKIFNRVLGRKPHLEGLYTDELQILWPDMTDKTKWYYAEIQEATNSHQHVYDLGINGNTYERWLSPLPVREWGKLEKIWSNYDSPANPGEIWSNPYDPLFDENNKE